MINIVEFEANICGIISLENRNGMKKKNMKNNCKVVKLIMLVQLTNKIRIDHIYKLGKMHVLKTNHFRIF